MTEPRLTLCNNCRFWQRKADFETRDVERQLGAGWCYRYPPVPVYCGAEEEIATYWPVTFPEEWCGEFKKV